MPAPTRRAAFDILLKTESGGYAFDLLRASAIHLTDHFNPEAIHTNDRVVLKNQPKISTPCGHHFDKGRRSFPMPRKPSALQVVPIEIIEQRILLIRGHKVMLDNHLAELYQVPTKRLNEAVKRNRKRFPKISCYGSQGKKPARSHTL